MPVTDPLLSFGLPVRNGAASIERCLESILAQDLDDFEIVVSDNASSDATPDIVRRYARRDARIQLFEQPENVGLIENFNTVARRAQGRYFRWIGADDWIEPRCASLSVDALEADPEAIVATSFFTLECANGERLHEEWRGEYLSSPDPVRRFRRMLWFFDQGATRYEPTYATIRRDALLATHLLRIHRNNDWLMSTQLALAGRFVHVPECLLHRSWDPVPFESQAELPRRLHPHRHPELRLSSRHLLAGLMAVIAQADLSTGQRVRCRLESLLFCLRFDLKLRSIGWRQFRRNQLGLTRDRLGLPVSRPDEPR